MSAGPESAGKVKKAKRQSVRIMAPFAMHCLDCGNFIYRGTKFNARKSITKETYLGLQVWAFEIRCPACGNAIVFKTDPKNEDYAVESGAKRNMEPWRDAQAEKETETERLARLEREKLDQKRNVLADLEASTLAVARETQEENELLLLQRAAQQLEKERRQNKHASSTSVPRATLEKPKPIGRNHSMTLPPPRRRKGLAKAEK